MHFLPTVFNTKELKTLMIRKITYSGENKGLILNANRSLNIKNFGLLDILQRMKRPIPRIVNGCQGQP